MNDVTEVKVDDASVFLNTGSPHHIEWVNKVEETDVYSQGRKIRYDHYGPAGANINFAAQLSEDTFAVRTYERGVEDETLSCGTGVTAVAIAAFHTGRTKSTTIKLETPGGNLVVRFIPVQNAYSEVYLEGPAVMVFKGEWI
jgi:diaminopimelate epimerase